nr:Ribosomal protein S3 [Polysiphonia sp.]
MSKKINLSGKCLALTKMWNFQFQTFNSFSFNKYLFNFLILKTILQKFLLLNKFSLILLYSKIVVLKRIYFIFLICLFNKLSFFSNFLKFWEFNFNYISFQLKILLKKNCYSSSDFWQNYLTYATLKLENSPKKLFNLIYLLLLQKLDQITLQTTRTGLKPKKFVGFKIQLRGRYELTKNAMSKSTNINVGKTNSTNLKLNIIFINYLFYTKLGVSSLKIWLFYSNLAASQ